jgi:hypothetical protein
LRLIKHRLSRYINHLLICYNVLAYYIKKYFFWKEEGRKAKMFHGLCIDEKRNESRHDKTNIIGVRPAWIKKSLRIRAVWSGSMLFAISFSTYYLVCKRTAWLLIRLRGYTGWSGSMLVANILCWFCHGAAQIILIHVFQ